MRFVLAVILLAAPALAQSPQPAPLASYRVALDVDSGPLVNDGPETAIVYSTTVSAPGAAWVRLRFEELTLSGDPDRDDASIIVLTSLLDGAYQTMNARHVEQWGHTSAYFNGDTVSIEIIAGPGSGESRLRMRELTAGDLTTDSRSICGPNDDRTLSSDPRSARVMPIGCSVWMINDCNHCFLTAGHCQGALQVVQFNVPLSTSSGGYVNPPPSDQYAVDPSSLQGNGGLGVGDDWAYFGVFANSTTGLTPFEAQGDAYVLASQAPPVSGQQIRVTGYGTVSSPVPFTWNGVQKTHVGPYRTRSGNAVQYSTDTTGGNSGSPVINESDGQAIGIHTHGGCGSGGGMNSGTASHHPGLRGALENPRGICSLGPIEFSTPDGLPATVSAAGGAVIRVDVAAGRVAPSPGSGQVHYDLGAGVVTAPMQAISGGSYEAFIPPAPCGTVVSYYFSVQGEDGIRYYSPGGCAPPLSPNVATAVNASSVILSENFQVGAGWTAGAPDDDATDGLWQRTNPSGSAAQPEDDHTPGPNGRCWITGADGGTVDSNDVDGGKTTLLSPVFDLSAAPNAYISYRRWFYNGFPSVTNQEVFRVDINNGAGWVNVEAVGPNTSDCHGDWFFHEFRVADYVPTTATVQLRFVAADNGADSIVEAAIDDFMIRSVVCGPCPGDLDGDTDVDLADLASMLANYGGAGAGDLDGDGDVDLTDLSSLLGAYGDACGS